MLGSRRPAKQQASRPSSRRLRPALEGLESKLLMYSTLGGDWTYGSRITYSFVPDGTSVGGAPSVLSQTMASRGFGESQWKNEFRRAAAVWQSVAKINLVEVADGGQAIGVSGNQQNDSRFGDIRIAAVPQGSSTLAYAYLPPDFNGGTRAGDVVFNSNIFWNINTTYDIQTVAIHEFGHSLGLDHSTITTAALYDSYNGVKQNLTSDDVAGIRSIYGARTADSFDAYASNDSPSTATNVTQWIPSSGKAQFLGLDVTTNGDVDWIYVQAPASASGSFRVTMQSSQLGSLSPRVQVYNAALQLAGWASGTSTTYGGTVTLNFTGVTPGTGLFIAALGWNGANSGVNGIGTYALQLDFSGGAPMPAVLPPNTTVAEQPDQGGGTINEEAFNAGDGELLPPSLAPAPGRAVRASALPWLDGKMAALASGSVTALPAVDIKQVFRLFVGLALTSGDTSLLDRFDEALESIEEFDDDDDDDSSDGSTIESWARRLAEHYRLWLGNA